MSSVEFNNCVFLGFTCFDWWLPRKSCPSGIHCVVCHKHCRGVEDEIYFSLLSIANCSQCVACRMGSALLSRFDLVFILLDKPDEVMNLFMFSTHVLSLFVRVCAECWCLPMCTAVVGRWLHVVWTRYGAACRKDAVCYVQSLRVFSLVHFLACLPRDS